MGTAVRAPRRLINGCPAPSALPYQWRLARGSLGTCRQLLLLVTARLAHAMEMDTAVRAGAAVIVIVCNDTGTPSTRSS